uniref:Uncharacterized protein n=1 Tax=Arundo donax TaxID=35708 RepID=A0A0A9HBE4_ARUDO
MTRMFSSSRLIPFQCTICLRFDTTKEKEG